MTERTDAPHRATTGALDRAFDDERQGWTRTTPVRRRVVLAEIALLATILAVTIAAVVSGAEGSIWFVAAWTIGLLAFVPLHSLLNSSIRGLFDRRGRNLDEHQIRVRDRSSAAVQWPATTLTLAAWVAAAGVVAASDAVGLGLATGFIVWFAAVLLPYWHLAWTLPGEVEPTAH